MSSEFGVVEVIPTTALQELTKAEVDVQIATAHRFPRVPSRSINEALDLATCTPEVAEKMAYTVPRDGKDISGPSVRLAEIIVYAWGNVRAGARIIDVGEKEVVAQGICHDLEKNVSTTVEVRRRIVNKYGKRYSDDMIVTTGNAACSIAFRNAVFKVIPPSLFQGVMEAAKIKAREIPVATRITKIRAWLKVIGVDDKTALALIDKGSWTLVDEDDVDIFNGIRVAISEGSTTAADAFSLEKPGKPEVKDPQAKQEGDTATPKAAGEVISAAQGKLVYAKLKEAGVSREDLFAHLKGSPIEIESVSDIQVDHLNTILDLLATGEVKRATLI